MIAQNQLQTSNKTFLGRHWAEHNVLRRYFESDAKLSILSFGCSTGEELLSLHALFPRANLYGCDIDWRNLQKARALLGEGATIFQSSDQALQAHGPYDVILCNSVLLSSMASQKGIDSQLWIGILNVLDGVLNDEGIIQIINSNIPFRFHPEFKKYRVLSSPLLLSPNFVDQYDLDGNRLCRGVGGAGWSALLHRHVADAHWEKMAPSDLDDIHFQKSGTGSTPINDELISSLAPDKCWASGTATYRPELPKDEAPCSYTEVDTQWKTIGVNALRIERQSRRIWFDGAIVSRKLATIDLEDAEAAVFIESLLGKRSSKIGMDQVFSAMPIRSLNF